MNSRSAAAPPVTEPQLDQKPHGLRNPRIAGDPATQRPGIDPQALGGVHLAHAQLAESTTEPLRRHSHSSGDKVLASATQGKLPHATAQPSLSRRANCPTFPSWWLVVRSQRHRDVSAGPSRYSKSSTTSSASWVPAHCRVTTRFVRSQPRAGACGTPWLRSSLAPTAQDSGFYANLPRSLGAPCSSCCAQLGGACGRSCDWLTRYERSGRDYLLARGRDL